MAESLTTRFGLKRWTADTDTPERTDFDSAHLELATNAAGWLPDDTLANRPAAAAANARFLFRATDTGLVYYSTGSNWLELGSDQIAVQTTAPSNPEINELWLDTDDDSIAVTTSHNALGDLTTGDAHTQYLNTTRHDVTARHPVSVLGDGSGLGLRQIVRFTSSGTFSKGNYPWARVARVIAVGGGGGGGGADATNAGEASGGDGGGGGSYAESLIDISTLGASETVTVGGTGAGGSGAADGSAGGTSSFGSLVSAAGGRGGSHSVGSASDLVFMGDGGSAGLADTNVGDIVLDGGPGGGRFIVRGNTYYSPRARGGDGGASLLGQGVAGFSAGASTSGNGNNGKFYGGGGSGAAASASAASRVGGTGQQGIVIVELYA